MNYLASNKTFNSINTMVFICALLASLVPRYITTFKIQLGINISLYTVAVVLTFILFVRKFVLYKKYLGYFFLIWLVFVLLSVWRAQRIGDWVYYVYWLLTAVLFSQILYRSDKKEVFECIVKGLLCGLVIHLLIGYVELLQHDYFFEVGIENRGYYGLVPISIFHNPNDYATFLVTVFPFAIYYMVKQKDIIRKIVFAFIVYVSVYMIIMTQSRTAFFAMVLLGLTLLWFVFRKTRTNKLIIILAIIIGVALVLVTPQLRQSIVSMFSINRLDIATTDRARWNLIRNGLVFLKETHGAGVGAGNLRYWLGNRTVYSTGNLLLIHNWYIEILSTFGVVFFILYMVFHIKIIVTLLKKHDKKEEFWNLNNTIFISFVGFSIISIASSSNIYSEWVWMYLIFVSTYALFRELDSAV